MGRVAFCLSPSGALRLVVGLDGNREFGQRGLLTVLGILLSRGLKRQVVRRIGHELYG